MVTLRYILTCSYLFYHLFDCSSVSKSGSVDLNEDDEIIMPSLTIISSLASISRTPAKPIFCDVDIENYCMCPESLQRNITKKTKAIIPVHFAGSACNMKEIIKIAKKNNLKIIEDCAQAHGTKYNKKIVGSFGNISCFSFYATKHMTTVEG